MVRRPLFIFAQPSSSTSAASLDPAPYRIRFVAINTDVKLEVLDWGRSGSRAVDPMTILRDEG